MCLKLTLNLKHFCRSDLFYKKHVCTKKLEVQTCFIKKSPKKNDSNTIRNLDIKKVNKTIFCDPPAVAQQGVLKDSRVYVKSKESDYHYLLLIQNLKIMAHAVLYMHLN